MTIKYLRPPTDPISYSWHGTRFMICNSLGSLLFQSVLRCSHRVPIKFSMCSPNMFPIAYVLSALPNVVLLEPVQVQRCKYWDLYVYVWSEYFMCLSLFGSFDSQCSQVVLGEKCEIKNEKMVKFVAEKTPKGSIQSLVIHGFGDLVLLDWEDLLHNKLFCFVSLC